MTTYLIRPEILAQTVHNPWSTRLPSGPAALRLHDCDINTQWQRVERKAGECDWSEMDRLAAMSRKAGLTWVDCIYGTPGFLATSKRKDAYGFVGGASVPYDLEALKYFVAQRLSFNVPRKPRLIAMIEAWNEPRGYLECCTPPTDPEPKGWRADWVQAVPIQRAVYMGARRADKGVRVLSMSMLAGRPQDWFDFIQAGGMAYADDLAIHAYGHDLAKFDDLLRRARVLLDTHGLQGKGLALTECGQQPRYEPRFLSMSLKHQVREWANCMLLAASWGSSCFVTYSEDPSDGAVQSRELYGMSEVYRGAAELVRPFVGKRIRKAAGWSVEKPVWVIGGRRVAL